MSAPLLEQEMEDRNRELCEYLCAPGEPHAVECNQFREAHAALRAVREEAQRLSSELTELRGVLRDERAIREERYSADRRLLERCRTYLGPLRPSRGLSRFMDDLDARLGQDQPEQDPEPDPDTRPNEAGRKP